MFDYDVVVVVLNVVVFILDVVVFILECTANYVHGQHKKVARKKYNS